MTEFLGFGVDVNAVVRQLAEINFRSLDVEFRHARHGRQILDEQFGHSFGGYFVNGSDRRAVAVRKGQMLVDPVSIRQTGDI